MTFCVPAVVVPVCLPKTVTSVMRWSAAIVTACRSTCLNKTYQQAYDDLGYRAWLRKNKNNLKDPVFFNMLRFFDAMDQESCRRGNPVSCRP